MSKELNLLIENTDEVEVLTEQTETGKNLYLEGIFAQAEVINGNRRFYEKKILESAADKYINEKVNKRRALGELNHPDYPFPDPDKAAIRITEMHWSGNNLIGKALVLNTPKGQTVRGLLEGGYAMGVSTRAMGSLKEKSGIKYVQDDLFMTAVDCVDGPSGPDCYPNAITESQKWTMNEKGIWVPKIDEEESDKVNEQLFLEKLEQIIKGL